MRQRQWQQRRNGNHFVVAKCELLYSSVYADTEITVLFYVNPIISLVAFACVCVSARDEAIAFVSSQFLFGAI